MEFTSPFTYTKKEIKKCEQTINFFFTKIKTDITALVNGLSVDGS